MVANGEQSSELRDSDNVLVSAKVLDYSIHREEALASQAGGGLLHIMVYTC